MISITFMCCIIKFYTIFLYIINFVFVFVFAADTHTHADSEYFILQH